jgi:hypothetical protein
VRYDLFRGLSHNVAKSIRRCEPKDSPDAALVGQQSKGITCVDHLQHSISKISKKGEEATGMSAARLENENESESYKKKTGKRQTKRQM